MTAICPGGGTSAPKAGHAAVVQYSAGLLATIAATYDLAWLIPVIPLLSFAPQVLSSFCASDPPTVSALTTAEANALLQLQFGADFDSGLAKVRDLYLNVIWHDSCECVSGTATPLAPPAPPSGTPIFLPPVASIATPCAVFPDNVNGCGTAFGVDPGALQNQLQFRNVSNVQIGSAVLTPPGTATPQYADFAIPFGTTRITINQYAGGLFVGDPVPTPFIGEATLLRTRSYIEHRLSDNSWRTHLLAEVYCGDVPGGVQQPCCQESVSTQAYLDILVKQVNLIQRQVAPFAYVYGANHTGLSGDGSIAVQGLLGCAVDVTTLPSSYGVRSGTPDELFDVGFVTLGTADGYVVSRRIDHDATLVLPPVPGIYSTIGYTLSPGVVVSIRELVREP